MNDIKRTIAVALPGESFSSQFLLNWTILFGRMLTSGWNVQILPAFSSNVYATRAVIANAILAMRPRPEIVLWIDDDNILTWDHFQELIRTLDQRTDIDGLWAWCWVQPDMYEIGATSSCGLFNESKHCVPYRYEQIQRAAAARELLPVDYSGFPVALMRTTCLVKAGKHPFAPYTGDEFDNGLSGEDYAFCRHAKERGGANLYMHPGVEVPHLKLRAVKPGMAGQIKAVAMNEPAKQDRETVRVL